MTYLVYRLHNGERELMFAWTEDDLAPDYYCWDDPTDLALRQFADVTDHHFGSFALVSRDGAGVDRELAHGQDGALIHLPVAT